MQTFLPSSSSRPPDQLLGARRPASPPSACLGVAARPATQPSAPGSPRARARPPPEPMAEAGRSPAEPAEEPRGQVAAEAPEPEASAPPPALRRLPWDPSPRGRSQSDLSSCSSRGRPLRVHISGSGKGGPGCGGLLEEGGRGQVAAAATQPGWGALGSGPAGWRREGGAGGSRGRTELRSPPPAALPGRLRLGPLPEMLGPGCGGRAGAIVRPSAEESAPTAARRWGTGCSGPSGRGTFSRSRARLRSLGRVRSSHFGGWAEASLGNRDLGGWLVRGLGV